MGCSFPAPFQLSGDEPVVWVDALVLTLCEGCQIALALKLSFGSCVHRLSALLLGFSRAR
jgi:hypothetical protein